MYLILAWSAAGLAASTDCNGHGATPAILARKVNDGYDYDQNGNVMAISDGRTGYPGDRTMTYDALDPEERGQVGAPLIYRTPQSRFRRTSIVVGGA